MKEQFKTINNIPYKECGVVMLETTGMDRNLGKLFKSKEDGLCVNHYGQNTEFKDCSYHHLYITSKDEIKVGNYATDGKNLVIWCSDYIGKNYKKIIATTDKYLKFWTDNENGKHIWSLPSLTDEFIQAFNEAYNKNEKIDEVLVEYEKVYPKPFVHNPEENVILRLKLNNNNSIIINN